MAPSVEKMVLSAASDDAVDLEGASLVGLMGPLVEFGSLRVESGELAPVELTRQKADLVQRKAELLEAENSVANAADAPTGLPELVYP